MKSGRLTTALVATAIPACSLLTSLDEGEYAGGTRTITDEGGAADAHPEAASADGARPPAGDGGSGDGGADADASLTNLLPQGSFEGAASSCTDLLAITELDVTRVAGGHDGGFACQLCPKGTVTTAYDYYGALSPHTVAVGDQFQTRVWVKSVSGSQVIESRIREFSGNDFIGASTSNNVSVGTTWKEIVVEHIATTANARINTVLFGLSPQPGTCALVDEWRVYKLP